MKVVMLGNWAFSAAIIRLFTFSRWHHCGVLVGDYVIEPRPWYGVKYTHIDSYKKRGRWAIIDIPLDDEGEAIIWLQNQVGKPYDYKALFRMVIHRDWEQDDKWYCSELVGYMMNRFRRDKTFSSSARGILPRDIALLPFKVVQVGYK